MKNPLPRQACPGAFRGKGCASPTKKPAVSGGFFEIHSKKA
jgi:hypothetical protein